MDECYYRVENRYLDVYVNGSIVARHELQSVPKQNDSPVYVNHKNGLVEIYLH